jgi:hypothetical protein
MKKTNKKEKSSIFLGKLGVNLPLQSSLGSGLLF